MVDVPRLAVLIKSTYILSSMARPPEDNSLRLLYQIAAQIAQFSTSSTLQHRVDRLYPNPALFCGFASDVRHPI